MHGPRITVKWLGVVALVESTRAYTAGRATVQVSPGRVMRLFIFPRSGSGLGTMPDPAEVAGLGLPVFTAPEGPPATLPSAGTTSAESETTPLTTLPSVGTTPTESGKTPSASVPGATTDKGKPAQAEAPHSFWLGDGLPPVPAKLVSKILKGEFVDMADLLRDNIEAERRYASSGTAASSAVQPARSHRREVPDLFSWVQCFGVYASVVASKQPGRVGQLLAYQTMIIREARRCGGSGWQAYDTMFRQQVAHAPETDWSKLNNTLYSVTFLAQQTGRGKTCLHCMETDHTGADCAVAPTRSQLPQKAISREMVPSDSRGRRSRSSQPCYSWNDGRCTFPYCRYRHVCSRCEGEHRRSHCRETAKGDPRRPM